MEDDQFRTEILSPGPADPPAPRGLHNPLSFESAVCLFFYRSRPISDVAQAMRDQHSRWLTEALARSEYDLPRIPIRREDEGGFTELSATPRGRVVCERWWRRALRAIFL